MTFMSDVETQIPYKIKFPKQLKNERAIRQEHALYIAARDKLEALTRDFAQKSGDLLEVSLWYYRLSLKFYHKIQPSRTRSYDLDRVRKDLIARNAWYFSFMDDASNAIRFLTRTELAVDGTYLRDGRCFYRELKFDLDSVIGSKMLAYIRNLPPSRRSMGCSSQGVFPTMIKAS